MDSESGVERVVIVGGGPAGATAAVLLGRAGVDVVLLEKGRVGRGKVCGEGILPPGVPVLAELGVLAELEHSGAAPIRGIRYVAPSGRSAAADFPAGPGLGVPRGVLDRVLFEAAVREPRVDARLGICVRGLVEERGRIVGVRTDAGEIEGRFVVAADGLSSVAHRDARIRRAHPKSVRVGLNAHWTGVAGLDGRVEVWLGHGFELYLTPEGEDGTLIAALVDGDRLDGDGARGVTALYDELVRTPAGLRARLGAARRVDEPRALGPLGLEVTPAALPGLLLAGDAAGALDPITGEGISLALSMARDASLRLPGALSGADSLARAAAAIDRAAASVARAREKRLADLRPLTRFALTLSRHPLLAERAVRAFARHPDVFARLLAVACGAAPYTSIRLRDKARLALS
jgi:flavin-dependent dehydrogenase